MAPHGSDVRTAIDINRPMTRALGSTRTWPVEKVCGSFLVERISSDLSNCEVIFHVICGI
jgi:hypothetical protein